MDELSEIKLLVDKKIAEPVRKCRRTFVYILSK